MLKNNLILAALLLSGCATPTVEGIKTVTQRVEIPVAVPCKEIVPEVPTYNFDMLLVDKDIYLKVQALLADRLLHLGYEDQLRTALIACVK